MLLPFNEPLAVGRTASFVLIPAGIGGFKPATPG
jgi:hypothetical protein